MSDYCGVKVESTSSATSAPSAAVRCRGEEIGHVTTAEHNSQMLSLGGVRHLTEGGKRKGAVVRETLLALLNGRPIELEVEDRARLLVQAGMARRRSRSMSSGPRNALGLAGTVVRSRDPQSPAALIPSKLWMLGWRRGATRDFRYGRVSPMRCDGWDGP